MLASTMQFSKFGRCFTYFLPTGYPAVQEVKPRRNGCPSLQDPTACRDYSINYFMFHARSSTSEVFS